MYQENTYELHTHLYGCLNQEDLRWLASRKEPRWHIFQSSFEETYGHKPDLEGIFHPQRSQDLRSYSVYESVGNFPRFQCCFDFVISVAHADEEELFQVAKRVSGRQKEPLAEYRMLFGPQLSMEEYSQRVQALCEGFEQADQDGYLVMSLWRGGDLARHQYDALQDLMKRSAVVRKRLVGVDFCAKEEGFPPLEKKELFKRIRTDNQNNPETSLAILYHVGESFQDKSLESAVRWVYQSAELGAHRLGHCIALGQDPAEFLNTERQESVQERIHQLEFERAHDLIISCAESELESEIVRLQELLAKGSGARRTGDRSATGTCYSVLQDSTPDQEPRVTVRYTEDYVERVRDFQNRLMKRLAEMLVVIEVCPTSNLRIGAIQKHPVHRFLEHKVPVVVGADDPGIFDTNLETEFQILERDGLSRETLSEMMATARKSHSHAMSGRA